jgi:hypothetical protein
MTIVSLELAQAGMRTITERSVLGVFTSTPSDLFGLFNLDLLGTELGPFMRTITKWLPRRTPTGAPPISSWLHFLDNG